MGIKIISASEISNLNNDMDNVNLSETAKEIQKELLKFLEMNGVSVSEEMKNASKRFAITLEEIENGEMPIDDSPYFLEVVDFLEIECEVLGKGGFKHLIQPDEVKYNSVKQAFDIACSVASINQLSTAVIEELTTRLTR